MKERRVMRHSLMPTLRPGEKRTHVVGCYPRTEYWRVALYVVAGNGDPAETIEVDMASEGRAYATQMHTVVVDQWRQAVAELGEIRDAWFDLYRVSPERHREIVEKRLARLLQTEVTA